MGFKVLILLALTAYTAAENTRLKEVFSWKKIDYAFEKPADRDAAIKAGTYKPDNNLPLGLDVWKDKLFVTVPRWKDGVASSLNYIDISDLTIPEDPDEPEEEEEEEKEEEEEAEELVEEPTPILGVYGSSELEEPIVTAEESEKEEEDGGEEEEDDDENDDGGGGVGDAVAGDAGVLGAVGGLLGGSDSDEDAGLLGGVGGLVAGDDGVVGAVGGLLGGSDGDSDGDGGLLGGVGGVVAGDDGVLGAVGGLLGGGDGDDDADDGDGGLLGGVGDAVTGDDGVLGAVGGLLGGDDAGEDAEGEDEDGGLLGGVGDAVTGDDGVLGAVGGLLGGDDEDAEGSGPDLVPDVGEVLPDAVGDLVPNVGEALPDLPLDAVGDAVPDVGEALPDLPLEAVGDAASPVLDTVGGVTDALPGPVGGLLGGATAPVEDLVGQAEDEEDEDDDEDDDDGDDDDDDDDDDDEEDDDEEEDEDEDEVAKKREMRNRKSQEKKIRKRSLASHEELDDDLSLLRKAKRQKPENSTEILPQKRRPRRKPGTGASQYKLRGEKNNPTLIVQSSLETKAVDENDHEIPRPGLKKTKKRKSRKGKANKKDPKKKGRSETKKNKEVTKIKNTTGSKRNPKNVDFQSNCRDPSGNPCGRPESVPIYAEISLEPPKIDNEKKKSKKKSCKKDCKKDDKSKKCKKKKKAKKCEKDNCVKPGKTSKTSPALIPYPSWEANTPSEDKSLDRITSVFRVRVDACDRLWVMDTGVDDILGKFKIYSPPQILIYNLKSDKLVKKYVFKPEDSQENSFFANIIVDVTKDSCDDAFAYIPDLGSYAILVYSLKTEKTHRIKHNFFHFNPLEGNYNVGGVNFQWTDGVFGVALTRPNPDNSRTAFFHALSSYSQFKVNSFVLQDPEQGQKSNYTAYEYVGNKGPNSQTSASFIHEPTGVMFYTQVNKDAIYCWNTDKPFNSGNLQEVASDDQTMIFPNDLKVDYNNNLWVLTDKLPVYVIRDLDPEEINYRIFVSTVADAIKDTTCAP